MTTEHYTSPDGLDWTHRGTRRSARVTAGGTPAACG